AIFQTGAVQDGQPWTMGPVWRWEMDSGQPPALLTELGTVVGDKFPWWSSNEPSALVEGPAVHAAFASATPIADLCWDPNGRLSWLGDDGRPEAPFAERAILIAGHRASRRVVFEQIGIDDVRQST